MSFLLCTPCLCIKPLHCREPACSPQLTKQARVWRADGGVSSGRRRMRSARCWFSCSTAPVAAWAGMRPLLLLLFFFLAEALAVLRGKLIKPKIRQCRFLKPELMHNFSTAQEHFTKCIKSLGKLNTSSNLLSWH